MKGCTSRPVTFWSIFLETTRSLQTLESTSPSWRSFDTGVPTRPEALSTSVPQATKLSALVKPFFSDVGILHAAYWLRLSCMISSSLKRTSLERRPFLGRICITMWSSMYRPSKQWVAGKGSLNDITSSGLMQWQSFQHLEMHLLCDVNGI